MAVDTYTPAVLQYIDHGAYPDSEDIASADLGPEALSTLLESLQKAQSEAKDEIRALSKATAPDVDTWITRAKSLQEDIARSRDTARQIVAEHEASRDLRAAVEDAAGKVRLLEGEVGFEEVLVGTLEHLQYANGVLSQVQNAAVKGDIEIALSKLERAEESIGGLEAVQDTRAYALLRQRLEQLKDGLIETTTKCWNRMLQVDAEEHSLSFRGAKGKIPFPEAGVPETSLTDVIASAQVLDVFDSLVQKLSKDIERVILRPRMTVDDDASKVAKILVSEDQLSCATLPSEVSYSALFSDLDITLQFLADHLPATVTASLSQTLVPAMSLHLEDVWLDPAVPLDISEMPAFQETLTLAQGLADKIDRLGWQGSRQLRVWVQNAPRIWLTKRRETVLGDTRNLVFVGLKETKTVERVETQMVGKGDALAGGDGAEDEWDSAWDEEEASGETETAKAPQPAADDDDEASAWDTDAAEEVKPAAEGSGGAGNEEDAWGWGDDEGPNQQQPPSPVVSKKQQPTPTNGDRQAVKPVEREMTLRETFTVTAVPEGILAIIKETIADAQTLAGPAYAESPIAPAATGLYTLPTLALAIYRATAPTAYSKLPSGNMLIYNDASHLASQLLEWQTAQPPASRLRLDNDVKSLEAFARKAYSSDMESQRTILRDLLDGASGFSNSTQPPYAAECQSAVEQTAHHLREVHRQWLPVLSQGALLQSLGSLLSTVTTKMISEIEDLADISEADSHQLKRLIDTISTAKELFMQPRSDGGEADMTFVYCPTWLKFQYLAEILESSLADIKFLWNEGELALEFEAEEVVELLEALFAESDLRRRAVMDIRRRRG